MIQAMNNTSPGLHEGALRSNRSIMPPYIMPMHARPVTISTSPQNWVPHTMSVRNCSCASSMPSSMISSVISWPMMVGRVGMKMRPRRPLRPQHRRIRPRNTPPARLNVCPAGDSDASFTSFSRLKSFERNPSRFIGFPRISHFCSTVLAAGIAIHRQM